MVSSVLKQAAEMLRRRKKNQWWLAAFLCLAVAAVVGTIAILKPTGQAMTREEQVLSCSYEVHQHTEGCYAEGENGKELVCGYADYAVHTHGSGCYGSDGSLACRLPEVEVHVHDANCYAENWILTCGIEMGAGAHEHSEECYGESESILICGQEESEEHSHTEECYEAGETPLICGQEAGEGGHQHTDECFQSEQVLVCEKPEIKLHTHGDTCYEKDGNGNDVLICGLLQVEEHVHGDGCFEIIEVEVADEEPETTDGTEAEDPVYICGLEEHTHGEECYDESGELICTLEEHTHDESCVETAEEAGVYTQSWENETYLVTVEYTDAANLPENAVLQVEEITEESDPEKYTEKDAEGQELVEDGLSMRFLLEIGFYVDGEAVEPQDTVKVAVQFLNEDGYVEGEPITIVHFAEEKTEVLEGTALDENGVTSFDTDSFSAYAGYSAKAPGPSNEDDLLTALQSTGNATIKLQANITYDLNAAYVRGHKTLDLNGHTITVTSGKSFVAVMTSANSLTITDSAAAAPAEETPTAMLSYGTGEFGSSTNTSLTYYKVESKVTDSLVKGSTAEYKIKYEVAKKGQIIRSAPASNSGDSLIYVHNSTFTLESGMLDGGNLCRAITLGGLANTLNLNGGYIFNCTAVTDKDNGEPMEERDHNGGAILDVAGSTINLSGSVITLNQATGKDNNVKYGNGGGIAMVNGGTLNITGGLITGNQSSVYGKGGGVYVDKGATVNLSDTGIICNNLDNMQAVNDITVYADRRTEYGLYDGGGGILVGSGCTLKMSGGQINGNEGAGGGGIQTVKAGSRLEITGGHISRNRAVYHEGGGLVIVGANGYAFIQSGGAPVYITNNQTMTTHDWGGGGIFCVESAHLTIQTALVTNNTANGYGGGVGGCSNAQVIASVSPMTLDVGTAIYENTANGNQTAVLWYYGSNDSATDDTRFAKDDTVFTAKVTKEGSTVPVNGFNDYYCEQYSTVSNLMLGGGYSNWIGSINNNTATSTEGSSPVQFNREKEDVRSATNRMGLTADPSDASKATAERLAKVFITGNDSATHGGGIQCNGIMVLGDERSYSYGDTLRLQATKQLLDADGNPIQGLENRQFSFSVYEYDTTTGETGKQVGATVKNDASGTISFNPVSIMGTNPNGSITLTYLVKETPESLDSAIEWSSREYLLTVTVTGVTTEAAGISKAGEANYTWTHYSITGVQAKSRNSGEASWGSNETLVSSGTSGEMIYTLPASDEKGVNGSPASFTNRKIDQTDIQVRKEWSEGEATQKALDSDVVSVTVELRQKVKGTTGEGTVYGTPITLEKGSWTYTWENLPAKKTDSTGTTEYEYEIVETGMTFADGSSLSFEQFQVSGSLDSEDGKVYVITNTHVDDLRYNLTLTKVMGDADGNMPDPENPSPLSEAVFNLYSVKADGIQALKLKFTGVSGVYEYHSEGSTEDTVSELTTNPEGKIVVENLPKGTYRFEEIRAPKGFVAVKAEDLKPVELGAATVAEYEKDVAYSDTPIVDALYYYKIPESGGMGTARYTAAGSVLLLLALGLTCFFSKKRRAERDN